LKIDIVFSEDRRSHVLTFDSGCYANGDVAYYEKAKPDTLYKFDYVPVEIRSRYDPYTVWAQSNYNLGKQSSGLSVTYSLLLAGVFFGLLTCYTYHKADRHVDEE
jgi:hypothetical protein